MSVEIKIQCECGHSKLITKSNISRHRNSKTHAKNMLALGTVEPQEFENTIICQEVKSIEPKVKVVKKTATKKTKPVEEVKQAVEEIKIIRKVFGIISDQQFIDELYNTPVCDINELVEEMTMMVQEVELIKEVIKMFGEECNPVEEVINTTEEPENYFDNPDVDPVYRYTVWARKIYTTNRTIEEIKRLEHPIFNGADTSKIKIKSLADLLKTYEEVPEVVAEVIKTIEEVPEVVAEVIKTIEEVNLDYKNEIIEKEKKRKDTYAKTKKRKKELETQNAIAVLFEEEFDSDKPYLCDIEYPDFKEVKNYKTRISNALKWIDESLEDCFHLEYTYSIIYNTKKKEVYLHLTDNETGKLFVRLCEKKIYYDTVSLYNKPNPNNANFTMKKIDKKPLVVMFEKLKKEILEIVQT